ncbi:helix-turn-helix transcriptional regulator [Syntrophothermus sp.]|uniref:helix-turn-helix domain-containing protein n=1 Tax=Syntrophothermus sp. TaxID=2736299 RepID=UPI00257D7018|nr:helix-turn-helix transcriptional regulator [Syntrophothermus sp.]
MSEKQRRLGARLRALRQFRGMTQEQLAEHADLHPTYVAKIEAGMRLPSLEALERLAAALRVSVASIVRAMDEEEGAISEEDFIVEVKELLKDCSEGQRDFLWSFIQLLKRYEISLPPTK